MASHLLPNRFEKVPKNSEALSTKIFCSSFDATGNLLITASQDCLIRVYDARNNFKNIQSQIGQDISWSIIDLDVSPDSQRFIYSSWSESIRMGRIDSITGHHEPLTLGSPDSSLGIFSVRFSPNLFEVLAGCSDNCVRIYDLERNMQVLRVRGHENQVNAVSFLDDSPNIIASGGDDDIVRVGLAFLLV
jgi:WD repeat-containing protein 23